MKKVNIDEIEILIVEQDRYLQINDISGSNLDKIWHYININYKDYDKWLCYHNTEIPFDTLNKLESTLEDDSIEMRLTANNFIQADTFDVEKLTIENHNGFFIYHDKLNPNMYWTSDRIKRDLSRWKINILKSENEIVGYILLLIDNSTQSEIFHVDALNTLQCKALITSVVNEVFDSGKNEILYMADKNTVAQKAAQEVGFNMTGFYKSYKISSK